MGIIFRTHATIHVSIDVNVTYLVEHCDVLQQQHPFGPSTTNHFMAVQRLLNQVCRDVNDLGNTGDPDRRKRQIFAALAVGFTSIFGIYGATQIHRIDQEIRRLDTDQLRRDAVLVHQSMRLSQVEINLNNQREAIQLSLGAQQQAQFKIDEHGWLLEMMAHIQEVAYQTNQISHGIQAANQGYLTTSILSKSDAGILLRKIRRLAKELGGKPIISSREDIYRLPVTVTVVGTHHLRLLVHAGVAREQLRLFRYRPSPMVVQDNGAEVTINIRPHLTLLAQNDHVHQELDETDLAACNRRGNTYVCQGPAVFHTQLRKTCLGALFAGDLDQVHARCPIEETDVPWAAENMANNQVATYFRNRTTLQLSCPNRERSNSYVQGNQLLTIPTNCSLLGDDLRIDAHSDILMEAPTTTYPIWNSMVFLSGTTPQGITDAREALERHQIRPSTNINDLLRQDAHLQETTEDRERGATIITAFYVSLAMNLVVGLYIVIRCGILWRQHRRATPTSRTESIELTSALAKDEPASAGP